MKRLFSSLLVVITFACGNQSGSSVASASDNSANQPAISADDCGNSLLFREGAIITTSNYDGKGKLTSTQASTVTKVYKEAGMTISELVMKNTDAGNATEKSSTAIYKCDGKQLFVDLSGFLSDGKKSNIETTGLLFPFDVSVGQTLPDAEYSINMTAGGKTRKMISHIRERKVEAKEAVTTSAGTFQCYKISSVIEVDDAIVDMDAESKRVMDEVKKKMGKNIMTFWYAPAVTIIKMDYKMGDRMIFRSEVTGIKN
jgi:hypothetical protein